MIFAVKLNPPKIKMIIIEIITLIRNCVRKAFIILESPSNVLSFIISLKIMKICRVEKNINA